MRYEAWSVVECGVMSGRIMRMMDFQTSLEAIDQLSSEELELVQTKIHELERSLYQERINREDAESWITELHTAIADFRSGLSSESLSEIVNDMNIGYISPKELAIL